MYRPETEERAYAVTPLGQFFAVFVEEHADLLQQVIAAVETAEQQTHEEFAELPVNEETRARMVAERK